MTRTPLPDVTLCALDTRTPWLAAEALRLSLAQVAPARAVLFTEGSPRFADIEVVDVGPIRSTQEYSTFMLERLADHVTTPHVLVIQWDGFVLQGAAWDPAFLQADYLGAPWKVRAPGEHAVGNGGFSLRSARLLRALRDPAYAARLHHPEDVCICQTLRPDLESRHGIVFGTLEQARRFAFENEAAPASTFGFHGLFNFARALDPEALLRWLRLLPDSVVVGRDAFKLARNLLRTGHGELARALLRQRRALGLADLRLRLLALTRGIVV